MSKYIKGVNRNQIQLLPQSIDEYIDDNNEVRVIDAINILNRAVEDELIVEETSAWISKEAAGYYSGDPVNYVQKKVNYALEYNSALGIVEKVKISD